MKCKILTLKVFSISSVEPQQRAIGHRDKTDKLLMTLSNIFQKMYKIENNNEWFISLCNKFLVKLSTAIDSHVIVYNNEYC